MVVTFRKYCDRCGKSIVEGTGAEVLKHTVNGVAHPTRHLCERCYGEVFERQIKKESGVRDGK